MTSQSDCSALTDEEIRHIDARGERQRELDRKVGLPDWRELEVKVKTAIESVRPSLCVSDDVHRLGKDEYPRSWF
jgi:hypothetical protein